MELEQAAKQQNEEMQQMDLELRQTENGLAELKRERAQRLDEARQAAAARAAVTEKSQAGPGWGVLVKCVALILFVLLVAEVLLRYYDTCADSLHAYLLELDHSHHHLSGRPS
jgi:cytochrome c-type biogenesis protein CcmH/NrfG